MIFKPRPIGEYQYRKMPPQFRKYIRNFLGKEQYKNLMAAITLRRWIIMSGPECSGKSTVGSILKAIGYPYVLDEGDEAFIIHTAGKLTDLTSTHDILESLGIVVK